MKTIIEIDHLYDSNIEMNKRAFNTVIRNLLCDNLGSSRFKISIRSEDV